MKLSSTAKVGLVTVLTLVLMVISLSWLTQTSFRPKGYRLKAVFNDVDGLLPGANVQLMGVRVGRVLALYPSERTVVVDLEIGDRATHILQGSHFKILNKGIIGEKNLEIFPPDNAHEPAEFITADSMVYGDTPPRLETAVEQAQKAINSLREMAEAPETKMALKDGLTNFQTAFRDLTSLIKHTDAVAQGAQGFVANANDLSRSLSPEDLSAIVGDLRVLSSGLRKSYQALSSSGSGLGDAQSTLTDARATMANLKSLTGKLDGLATEIEKFSTDPKVKHDMKDLVANSGKVVSQVGTLALNPPKLSPRFDLMGVHNDIKAFYGVGNFNLGIRAGEDAFVTGVEEIGENNLWNVSWGKPDFLADGLGFHLGMVRSKLGAGVDWQPLQTLEVKGELFDPAAPEFRLSANYFPSWWGQKYGFTAAWIRELGGNTSDRLFVGAQWRPLD